MARSLHRRQLLGTLGAIAASLSCRRESSSSSSASKNESVAPARLETPVETSRAAPKVAPRSSIRVVDWQFANEGGWDKRCTVILPDPLPKDAKLPLLIALHGMGETVDPITGANGWLRAYELDVAIDAVTNPPLDTDAFRGLVTSEHLTEVNASLQKRPYGGLVICCPYLPRAIGGELPHEEYARFLGASVIPRLRDEMPILGTVRSTGIDGVSLGGATALTIGLMREDLFGAVGALQPALYDGALDAFVDTVEKKLSGRPLRVTTSEEDVYRDVLVALDAKLAYRGIAHDFAVRPGPHDYIWNKGPGAIEMLLWHDRVLRG